MKLRNLFLGVCSAMAVFAACEQVEENLGTPDISISANEMTFEIEGGEQELTVTATRDWKVETDADWVVVSPESGVGSLDPQTVTVTALENTGMDRSADLKFTIGMKSKYLTVSQAGPGGSVEALIVYYNNYDKAKAEKTFGSSGDRYPYLDQFDGWKNATGTGVQTVEYAYNAMSTRSNSTSDSSYSDYPGSGMNNMFFGASAYFATKNITLPAATGYTLTFGTEKYDGNNKEACFDPAEFHVYLSNDGTKWVEQTYTFAGTVAGRWNIASTDFSVPSGTTNLSICIKVDAASVYRMDDLKLVISEGGDVVDFSKGVEMDFTAGGNTGGGNQGGGESDVTAIYSNNYDKSAAVQGSNGWPFLDSSDAWKNAAGTGAANVTYASKNVTVRNNSNSNGNYSDYEGSGLNNIFFGKDYPYFATKNIALNGATGLTLTFGTEKYSQTLGSTFTNSEYHIYLSNDGAKWVELTDYTFAGTADGRWNVATANFTVPAGTETLSICMQVDAESSYRLDDMKLVASEGGVAVDFTAAVEKDFNAGATDGGNTGGETPTPPAGEATMTIAEVLAYGAALPSGTTIEGVVISNMDLNNLTSKKGMYVQDATAGLQFYLAANHTFAYGDKVQIDLSGVTVGAYNGAVQISNLGLDKIAKVSSGNTVTPKTVTMADFLANKYEGQYIALEGVQVADSDLSNTFVMGGAHTSINMEDASGNKFVVFSSKYATYGAQTVPQGSGTIKGISSINNGTMQIIFCQASDFAGLTNTRFDGTEVTPPAGGDDNQGGDDNGGEVTPPADGVGPYDIYGVTWTLGTNAYDNTSGSTNTQTATVNGVSVPNLLKLGTSSKVGDATLHVASGTTKIGFYCVAWKGKKAQVKFSTGGTEITTINPVANVGATGNAPYTALNVADSDYFEVELPAGTTDIKVETLDPNNGRVLFVGLQVK